MRSAVVNIFSTIIYLCIIFQQPETKKVIAG